MLLHPTPGQPDSLSASLRVCVLAWLLADTSDALYPVTLSREAVGGGEERQEIMAMKFAWKHGRADLGNRREARLKSIFAWTWYSAWLQCILLMV